MFPARFFPNRMFAPRFFPKVGAEAVSPNLDSLHVPLPVYPVTTVLSKKADSTPGAGAAVSSPVYE